MAEEKEISYIDYSEALTVYEKTIKASGGGLAGVGKEGSIKAVLDFIKNDDYYPSFPEKLNYLVYGLCSGHCFFDGNKRISLTLGTYFLHKNGYYWEAGIFMRQFEAIVYHVAAGNIDKDLLQRLIQCFMDGNDYDEELKIDLAEAINNGKLGIDGEDYNNGR